MRYPAREPNVKLVETDDLARSLPERSRTRLLMTGNQSAAPSVCRFAPPVAATMQWVTTGRVGPTWQLRFHVLQLAVRHAHEG